MKLQCRATDETNIVVGDIEKKYERITDQTFIKRTCMCFGPPTNKTNKREN